MGSGIAIPSDDTGILGKNQHEWMKKSCPSAIKNSCRISGDEIHFDPKGRVNNLWIVYEIFYSHSGIPFRRTYEYQKPYISERIVRIYLS